jgi:hypothetical protein
MITLYETLVDVGFDPSDAAAITGKFLNNVASDLGPVVGRDFGPDATVEDAVATVDYIFTENDLNQRLLKIASRYLARLPKRKQDQINSALKQAFQPFN